MSDNKLKNFMALVESNQIQGLVSRGLDCEANINNAKVSCRPGRKYISVDIGRSARFMIEISTGNIYGTKAWNQIHKGHQYGTLDTIDEWDWSEYYPRRNS